MCSPFVEETNYSGRLILELQCLKGHPPILHIKSMFTGLKKVLLRSSPLVYRLQSHKTVGLMMDNLKTDDQIFHSFILSSFQNIVPTLPTMQFDSP